MANTYTALYYHLVFSTKNRLPWIDPEFEERIWRYLGGVAREHKMTALQVGGLEDHIHMAIQAPPTLAPAKIAQLVKGASSSWIHETFPALADFAWQDGYGAFTVSKSNVPQVITYVQYQRDHHRAMSFQVEYRGLLDRHEIEYDERYIWD
jgi:REP element-mobilizing transposase RayT